jgi:hypothetical protein
MNQLKIILLIILLILLVCINRKKEKFETKKTLEDQRDVRQKLLHRCTDDINRLVNKLTKKSLNDLGITTNKDGDSEHNIDTATKEITYAKSLNFTDTLYPKPVHYHERSIFTDIRDSDGGTLTNTDTVHDLISDFGILDVKSKFNIS